MSTRGPSRFEYRDIIELEMRTPLQEKYAPCVLPNWDNTPRSGRRGVVFEGQCDARPVRDILKERNRQGGA